MLSQVEIDALLGAVAAEEPAPETAAVAVAVAPAPPRFVRPYDFRHPDKFSKDQLRTLQAIHENVARIVGARLGARLRTGVAVQLVQVEQMVFDEYVQRLVLPTQLIVLSAERLGGPLLVDMDLGLAYAILDRAMGGAGTIPAQRREPTAIEVDLIRQLVDELTPAFHDGWTHLEQIDLRVVELALGPALLRVAAPLHVVAVLTFEVRLAGQAAPLTVCYPHAALEPLLPRLSASAWYSERDRQAEPGWPGEIERVLRATEVEVTATIGSVELPVRALAELRPGDVIRLDERTDHPISIGIARAVRGWAVPGRIGERVAVRLVSGLHPVEE